MPVQCWRHVRSQDNPADPLFRGIMPKALIPLKIWWAGPPWLVQDTETWPQISFNTSPNDILERRAKTIVTISTTSEEFDIFTLG